MKVMRTIEVLRWNLSWAEIVVLSPFMVFALVGCAGSAAQWTDKDTESLTSMEDNALSLETACDRDGGPCNAAMVRAVERAQVCGTADRLYVHRQTVHDTSPIRCTRATTDGGKP